MKKNAKKEMEYSDIIEAILGGAQACNLEGHHAQIVTSDTTLAKVLVKGFCDAQADHVDVVFTDEACFEEFVTAEEEIQTEEVPAVEVPVVLVEEVEAVPAEDTAQIEAAEAVAVEE